MNDPYSDFGYTEEEITLLMEHDTFETLHAFYAKSAEVGGYGICGECGDTAEGLMHNNTWRNVEPLLPDSYFENQGRGDLL